MSIIEKFLTGLKNLSIKKKFILWVLNTTFWLNFWIILFFYFYIKNSTYQDYFFHLKNYLTSIENYIEFSIKSPVSKKLSYLTEKFLLNNLSKQNNSWGLHCEIYRLANFSSLFIKKEDQPYFKKIIELTLLKKLTQDVVYYKNGKFFLISLTPVTYKGSAVVIGCYHDLSPEIENLKKFIINLGKKYKLNPFIIDLTNKVIISGNKEFKISKEYKKLIDFYNNNPFQEVFEKNNQIYLLKKINDLPWIIGVKINKSELDKLIMKKFLEAGKMGIIIITFGELIFLIVSIWLFDFILSSIKKAKKDIANLAKGEIEELEKINIYTKDEIGELIQEVNKLISLFKDLKSFKELIEGDETLKDVYYHFAHVLKGKTLADECVLLEISNSKNKMNLIYPEKGEAVECLSMEPILNTNLCRVRRTVDVVNSLAFPQICKYFTCSDKYFHICFPIMSMGNVGGVVILIFKKEREKYLKENLEKIIHLTKMYIKEAEPVIDTRRLMEALKESSLRDPLTGLFNRRFLEESYEHIASGILRRGTLAGILMCDIDNFKKINDLFGHDVGDEFLRRVAYAIKSNIRKADIAIRWGGEEFLIILIDIKKNVSFRIAEKIRKRVEEISVSTSRGIVKTSISIGISEFPVDTEDFMEAIKFADIALYKAKKTGKNRVIRFSEELLNEEVEEEPI